MSQHSSARYFAYDSYYLTIPVQLIHQVPRKSAMLRLCTSNPSLSALFVGGMLSRSVDSFVGVGERGPATVPGDSLDFLEAFWSFLSCFSFSLSSFSFSFAFFLDSFAFFSFAFLSPDETVSWLDVDRISFVTWSTALRVSPSRSSGGSIPRRVPPISSSVSNSFSMSLIDRMPVRRNSLAYLLKNVTKFCRCQSTSCQTSDEQSLE